MGPVELFLIALILAVPLALLFALWRKGRPTDLGRWAEAHDVVLTDRTEVAVQDHLQRNLKWRMNGALVGILIPFGTKIPGLELLIGYLAGAILAELTAKPLVTPEGHRAVLSPRSVGDYLPAGRVTLFRSACALAVVVPLLYFVVPIQANAIVSDAGPMILSAGAALLAGIVEATQRFIVQRKQPAGSEDFIAADDALRSAAMHATLGAGMAIAFLLLGTGVLALSIASTVQVVRWIGPAASVGLGATGVLWWLRLGHDTPWVVKRPTSQASA